MKNRSLMMIALILCLFSTCGIALAQDEFAMIYRYDPGEYSNINPLTGLEVEDVNTLAIPPTLIPLARFPEKWRPSFGHSDAAWVFELYVNADETRPMMLFYGSMPKDAGDGSEPKIGRISSAVFGTESLRKQYGATIITTPISQSVLNAGVLSYENWYGVNFDQLYPTLPISNLKHIQEKWAKKSTPADPNNLAYEFSEEAPEEGWKPGTSFHIQYAPTNRILWEYDEATGTYLRNQNSTAQQNGLSPDIDQNNGKQIGASNVIVIEVPHVAVPNTPPEYHYFDLNLNYSDEYPAYIFRDGKMFEVTWTTISKNFEQQSNRMRPIRFTDKNGNSFPLRPGQTWVHFVIPDTPLIEVDLPLGDAETEGSGHWRLNYISFK